MHFVQKFKLKLTPLEMQTIHISYFLPICDEMLTIPPSHHGHSIKKRKLLLIPEIRVSLGLLFLSPLSFISGFC